MALPFSVSTQHDTTGRPALRLRPFRAMRYAPDSVGDVGEVTSPPYDVMDRPMIDSLLQAHSRNIVRLILPRMVSDPVMADSPYLRAAKLLQRWRDQGVLVTDPTPALYIYEYGDAERTVCGLVGAADVFAPQERVILPHEDVIEPIVADRLAMMTASEANLEPILLVYDGDGAADSMMAHARAQPPLTDVTAADGTFHRLWCVTDQQELDRFADRLATGQALIADGHHRYASYLQLRGRHHEGGDGDGPWDQGLALLIDQSRCPLQLSAIHRSVAELSLSSVTVPDGCELTDPVALSDLPAPAAAGQLVVTDGTSQRTIRLLRTRGALASDAEFLHNRLLPSWQVTEDRIGYHHTVQQAIRNSRQDSGVAVLMHPTTVAEVMKVALAGGVMPRKSTSFGPKPRMGLVMRCFADEG